MLINLQSQVFKDSPADKFSKQYDVPDTAWNKVWYRYKWLEYHPNECREWFALTYKKELGIKAFRRWVIRTEIYLLGKEVEGKATDIDSSHFGEYQEELPNFIRDSKSLKESNDNTSSEGN